MVGEWLVSAAIILGGQHTWQREGFESLCPRLLLPIAHAPLALHIFAWLREVGVRDVVLCTNQPRVYLDQLGDHVAPGVTLQFLVDHTPRGPAGCARDAAALVPADQYLVLDGTVLPAVDSLELLASHRRSGSAATVVVHEVTDPRTRAPELSPAGIYVLERRVFPFVPATGFQDIKEMLIPRLHRAGLGAVAYRVSGAPPQLAGLSSYLAAQAWMLGRLRRPGALPAGFAWDGATCRHETAQVAAGARLNGPVMLGPHVRVAEHAIVIGPTVIGAGTTVGPQAAVGCSVCWSRSTIGRAARVEHCLVTSGAHVEDGSLQRGSICAARGKNQATLAPRPQESLYAS